MNAMKCNSLDRAHEVIEDGKRTSALYSSNASDRSLSCCAMASRSLVTSAMMASRRARSLAFSASAKAFTSAIWTFSSAIWAS